MTDELDNILNHFGISSTASKKMFEDKSVIKKLPKNINIFVEQKKNEFEYFLISGVTHRYNLSDKGEIVTTGFYIGQSIITPHFARTNKGKSIFNLQSLTNIVLVEIPVVELNNLRNSNREFQEFGQKTIEAELTKTFYNEVIFRSYSAKERLLELRKQCPNLENLILHNIIASYLGITNVSFSRLRRELTKS
jgi:CRP-like cAMP-binding protein